MSYANRHSDFESLDNELLHNDVVFLIAGPAFGITSFLHEHIDRCSDKCKCFYINAGTNRSIATGLLNTVICSDSKEKLQKLADAQWGERNKNFLQAMIEGAPYVGPLLAHMADKETAAPVYTGNYLHALAELLVPLFKEITKNYLIEVIIDSAQGMDESSYSVIAELSSIPKVTTVMAITENNDRYIKVRNHLTIYSKLRIDTILFNEPNLHLISELAKNYELTLSDYEIDKVFRATHKNIHRIIESISNYSSLDTTLSRMQSAIVILLSICSEGLSQDDICSMIQQSNVFTQNAVVDVKQAINTLYERNLLTTKIALDGTKSYVLVGWHHPLVESCLSVYSDNLYYRNLVYEYYEQVGIDETIEKTELMYSLSRELSQTTQKKYAGKLLEKKLEHGETIAEDIVFAAELSKRNNRDISLATLYYCRERRYGTALEWLERLRGKKQMDDYKNLRAVLLNRVRRMDEAEVLFQKCIESEFDNAKLNILYAYSLVNSLHLHGSGAIRDIYLKPFIKLSGTTNYGYFARNFASAVPASEKEAFYRTAVAYFEENRDDFGLFSTHCNWGNSLCAFGNPKEASGHLAEAEIGLQQFGVTHLHILYNDIGMCHFMNQQYSEAEKYYSLSNRLGLNTMPLVMVTINRACLSLAKGEVGVANDIMAEVWDQIQVHKVWSLKNKYYTNLLLVKYSEGIDTVSAFIDKYSNELENYVDSATISQYTEFIKNGRNYCSTDLHTLYCPSGLAYWYIDPLKLV